MRRLALGLAILVATFATTGGLAQAQPGQRPSPAYVDGDQFCGTGGANSCGTGSPDVAGWYPHRYNGLSDWLASRDVPAEVAGKPSASASGAPDAGERGTLSSEPE